MKYRPPEDHGMWVVETLVISAAIGFFMFIDFNEVNAALVYLLR